MTINCPTCLPIDCAVPNDIGLYDLATAPAEAPLKATAPVINCRNPDDLQRYSLESGLFFTSIRYGFVLDCPPGYTCAGGYYPRTIVIPPGDATITVPDDIVNDDGTINSPFSQSLTCCNESITIEAPTGTTLTALTSLISDAFYRCAAAKAACQNLTSPAPGVPAPQIGVNRLRLAGLSLKACLSTAYSSNILAQNATGRVAWKLVAGGLPPGLILEDKSVATVEQSQSLGISGTPAIAGNYDFTITASDSLGFSLTKTFTIAVLGITNSPSAATVGTPYSFQFTADGGTGPYTFSALPGVLPDGLTLSDSGLLSGTPENGDQTIFTVTVTDSSP